MRIGLIDVDGHNFPNLPLMKLSAWHKAQGDIVEWYNLIDATTHFMLTGRNLYNRVYMSKVFSFTHDYDEFVFADEIQKGGSGYCISLVDGKEHFDKLKDIELPYEIEHIYPDYSIYERFTGWGQKYSEQTAFGFLSRGCPRGCSFCHVKDKEGRRSYAVASLSEFWAGQKNINLLDPNILACSDWKDLLQQCIDSKAKVDFNQGLDIRLMTDEKAKMIQAIRTKDLHFAWDRYEDKHIVQPKFKEFRKISTTNAHNLIVYVLVGDRERRVLNEDLERIYWLRDNGFAPYVMVYDKENLPAWHELRKLQGWVNNKTIFWKCSRFEDFVTNRTKLMKVGD